MKKVQDSKSKRLHSVKIYRDDIEKILNILKDEGYTNLEIRCDGYEYDSAEEFFQQNVESVADLELVWRAPNHISIHFEPSSGSIPGGILICSNRDSSTVLGIFQNIEAILKARKVPLALWGGIARMILLTIPIALIISIALSSLEFEFLNKFWIRWAILFIMINAIATLFKKSLVPNNNILLTPKRENPGYFKKYKDQILLVIITNLITNILTFFLTKYFE